MLSLLVAATTAAALSAANPLPVGATTVAYYDFQARNGGFLLPEGWTRAIQPGYPFFVDVEMTDEHAAVEDRSIVFRLNGGHCALFSPRINAEDVYNYIVQGQIKTVGLQHDVAFLLLEFLDSRQRVVGSQHLSQKIGGTQDWTTVTIGPVAPPSNTVRFVRIACFSQHGQLMDLEGTVYFDDLWVGRLPRVHVTSSAPYRLFELSEPKTVSIEVTGLDGRELDALFYLYDEKRQPISEQVAELSLQADDRGTADWDLPISDVGYFHLDIALREGNRRFLSRDYPVTVVRMPAPVHSDFGMSAPQEHLGLEHLQYVLTRSASRWLKLPLWASRTAGGAAPRSEEFALFLERLEEQGHTVVAAMERAPDALLQQLTRPSVGVAPIFLLPEDQWSPEIEGLQARYGLKITQWQIGADEDTSFEALSDPNVTLAAVKEQMALFGRDLSLGVPWSWHTPPPQPGIVEFLSLTDAPPKGMSGMATAGEWTPLDPYSMLIALQGIRDFYTAPAPESPLQPAAQVEPPVLKPVPESPKLWVQMAPISERYGREEQVLDLFFRILAAKEGAADRIVCTNLDRPRAGFFNDDGAPTELFTIWRTASEYLGNRTYQGRLYTGDVENRILSDGRSATAVVWSQASGTATLTTGTGTSITDLWGRSRLLEDPDISHTIPVGPLPVLLTGCNGPLLRLQMETRFRKGQISSELGRHTDELIITNPFPLTLTGTVTISFPPAWRARPTDVNLQLQPGATAAIPIQFDIPQGMSQGRKMVSLAFDVSADRVYQFEIERPYRLGLDEIDVTAQIRLLANGDLEVRVAIANVLEIPLSLHCLLRAYQRNVIISDPVQQLPPREVATRVFLVPNGAELAGRELKLELHQTNGTRQFNIEIPVKLD